MPDTIGVAISTHNRRSVFTETLRQWRRLMPPGGVLVVVDDASDTPVTVDDAEVRVIRQDYRRGVAMTKNRCIAELADAGCDHLFLADDDCHPLVDRWWAKYVGSPEPHLSYQWPRPRTIRGHRKWRIVHSDARHFSLSYPRGCLLYAERRTIDTVGGMDPAFGLHGLEHVEWQQRIHAAGLTRWPFADVTGSDRLWWSLDRKHEGGGGFSTLPFSARAANIRALEPIIGKKRDGFMPYREHPASPVQDYQLGPRLADTPGGVLDFVLGLRPYGVALEFGVAEGESLSRIAARMPVVGFDSFDGLPERWRDGFEAGMFACEPPDVPGARLVRGLFADTVPGFDPGGPVGLVHFDADLYSSTRDILNHLDPGVLRPGTFAVFDEWHGYPGCEDHEQRAWREYADRTGISWTVLGHGPEQWALRIV